MNVLLTDLPAAGPDPALATPANRAPEVAAGGEGAGREFALLLHREIVAEANDPAQIIDFNELSLLGPGVDGNGSVALDGALDSGLPATDAAVAIDLDRFTTLSPEPTGRGEEAWTRSGAILPHGGISLPPSLANPVTDGATVIAAPAATISPGGAPVRRISAGPGIDALPPAAARQADAVLPGSEASTVTARVTPQPGAGALPGAWTDSPLALGDAETASGRLPAGTEPAPLPRLEIAALEAGAQRPVESAPLALAPLSEMRSPGSLPSAAILTLPPGAGAREWGDAVGERINWMINREQSAATLRLDPPALGKLDVQLRISDEATTITIQTQHAQARDLLDAAAPRLRELLLDNGFQNVNVDVSQRQDRQQADSGWNGSAEDDAGADGADSVAGEGSAGPVRSGDRLLDTFA